MLLQVNGNNTTPHLLSDAVQRSDFERHPTRVIPRERHVVYGHK